MGESWFGLMVDRVYLTKWVVYAVAHCASRNHSLAFYGGKKWVLPFARRLAETFAQFENRKVFPKKV